MFSNVRDMLWQKLIVWNSKLLLAAGKEVLIKAVGQALPTYTMGVFILPQNLCHELSAMIAHYWWGRAGGRGIHCLGWWKLCKPKCLGGIGFINFEAYKKAMVAKQAWRILEDTGSLMGRLLKARYFPNGDFMQATTRPSPSMTWKANLWGREVVEEGLVWHVGSGRSIRIFQDRWIPESYTFKPLQNGGLESTTLVSDIITPSRGWNQA
ncbi:unnamed protein product [Prunus armeniaca]